MKRRKPGERVTTAELLRSGRVGRDADDNERHPYEEGTPAWQLYLLIGLMLLCMGIAYPIVIHPMLKFAFFGGGARDETGVGTVGPHPLRGKVVELKSFTASGERIQEKVQEEPDPLTAWVLPIVIVVGSFTLSYLVVTVGCAGCLDSFQHWHTDGNSESARRKKELENVENRFATTETTVHELLSRLESIVDKDGRSRPATAETPSKPKTPPPSPNDITTAVQMARATLEKIQTQQQHVRQRIGADAGGD